MFNNHNMHVWTEENPHTIHGRSYHHRFSINVLCEIVGIYFIGPFVLPDRLKGTAYTIFGKRLTQLSRPGRSMKCG
jgi:hypothetical protein